mmetsp:Transcript_10364/g.22520  ORF Transcript_10364/g.22520 Transcript_10364/m.22520 type:complete len:250 (-) Transcript_10364:839-1588(-)
MSTLKHRPRLNINLLVRFLIHYDRTSLFISILRRLTYHGYRSYCGSRFSLHLYCYFWIYWNCGNENGVGMVEDAAKGGQSYLHCDFCYGCDFCSDPNASDDRDHDCDCDCDFGCVNGVYPYAYSYPSTCFGSMSERVSPFAVQTRPFRELYPDGHSLLLPVICDLRKISVRHIYPHPSCDRHMRICYPCHPNHDYLCGCPDPDRYSSHDQPSSYHYPDDRHHYYAQDVRLFSFGKLPLPQQHEMMDAVD